MVGTLAVCFSIANLFNLDELEIIEGNENAVAAAFGISGVAALSYLVFNLFSPPCFAAIGAMNSELQSKKWLFGAVGLQFGVGYTLSFLVYFFGTLFCGESLGEIWMPILGWLIVAVFIGTICFLISKKNNELSDASDKKRERVGV